MRSNFRNRFKLVFKNHNLLKNECYQTIANSFKKRDKTLLCIGSGKGGDVNKWSKYGFTKVLCVEPNEDNREELESRLKINGKITSKILPNYGQDFNVIFDECKKFFNGLKVDAIVYMLSLSFFFYKPLKVSKNL